MDLTPQQDPQDREAILDLYRSKILSGEAFAASANAHQDVPAPHPRASHTQYATLAVAVSEFAGCGPEHAQIAECILQFIQLHTSTHQLAAAAYTAANVATLGGFENVNEQGRVTNHDMIPLTPQVLLHLALVLSWVVPGGPKPGPGKALEELLAAEGMTQLVNGYKRRYHRTV